MVRFAFKKSTMVVFFSAAAVLFLLFIGAVAVKAQRQQELRRILEPQGFTEISFTVEVSDNTCSVGRVQVFKAKYGQMTVQGKMCGDGILEVEPIAAATPTTIPPTWTPRPATPTHGVSW